VKTPAVLAAFNPIWAIHFFAEHGVRGIVVLGSVFLVATGAEAIYADLGHFGAAVIRRTWFAVAFPALMLNYLGQGALLLRSPLAAEHPFYLLVPSALLVPVLLIATVATCIASQAVITGAFSLTRQAIQLGYLPRLQVRHTSVDERGQIYIPEINYLLMGLTMLVVGMFRNSAALAAAYGIAVTSTMVVTSVFLFIVLKERRGPVVAAVVAGGFFAIDVLFFSANAMMIVHGGWFPLLLAVAIVVVMTTWAAGRRLLTVRLRETSSSFEELATRTGADRPLIAHRTAVFLSRDLDRVPPALWRLVHHLDTRPERSILVHVSTEPTPKVSETDRFDVSRVADDVYRVAVRYGFMEEPNIPAVIAKLPEAGVDLDPDQVVYVLGRETIVASDRPGMAIWRERLFGFLSRNSSRATTFYHLPPEQVVEVGAEIHL
jgi:KUP system potassium uptake protein